MTRRLTPLRAVGLVILALVAGLALWLGPTVRALLRSTDQFLAWPADPRVRYEAGAERMAAEVAAALPEAIRRVEQRQYRSFAEPPTIYVCATLTTFGSYGGDATSGGYVLRGRLFVSPKPANTAERIPRLLAHELSHLELEQQRGIMPWRRLPVWFLEGLAAYVSGGAGAENVTEDEARAAILAGRVLVPETSASWFHPSSAATFGLTAHLFYREAAMFLGDLERRDPERFRRFLLAIQDRQALGGAFEAAYAEPVPAAWARFVNERTAGSKADADRRAP